MKNEYKPLLCKQVDIARCCGMQDSNVHITYVGIAKKQKMLKVLDMGAYCVLNDISQSELKMFASMSIEVKKHIMDKINGRL